jgi:hypothetical protein
MSTLLKGAATQRTVSIELNALKLVCTHVLDGLEGLEGGGVWILLYSSALSDLSAHVTKRVSAGEFHSKSQSKYPSVSLSSKW